MIVMVWLIHLQFHYDNLDNDCDGDTNEGCSCDPSETRQCGSTSTGACSYGTQTCSDIGVWGTCVGAVNPSIEICDGLDNDCDSDTDEGNANCCSPDGRTRDCNEDPACPGFSGKESCINYQWSGVCNADCPKEKPELEIINPEQDKRYYTCDDELNIPLDYDYPGLCQYQLNSMKSFRNAEETIRAQIGSNRLKLKCGSEVKSVGFYVIRNDNCKEFKQKVDDETKELFKSEGIDENLIDIAENTPVDQEHQFSYLGDETHIISSIIPKKELKEFDYYLYIPKCVLEELGDVTLADLNIAYKNYEIIKEDPIIAWHFVNVNDRIDLNIDVKGRISEDCLKQIRGLPIEKALGVDVHIEKPFDWKNYLAPIIVIIIAVGIAGEFIYFKKHHHLDEPHTEKEHEQDFIHKEWNILYKKVKAMKPKTTQQANNMMKNLNYSEAEREYILKKLKLK